ncbi:MAG: DUF333 domain-containing protein [Candidatus Scalindua sp.]|jgi:putative hemolysin|nr:DUF333 domain-containing protein [Candidatus Scalindua sp.]
MKRCLYSFIFLLTVVILAVGCSSEPKMIGMPNHASVFCIEKGGDLEIRSGKDGGEVGYCVFEDGSECEEWALFRGECRPGDSLQASK